MVKETTINVTGYSIALTVMALATLGFLLSTLMFANEALEAKRVLMDTQDALRQCSHTVSKVEGRLDTFEQLLVRTHQSAILTSVKQFERHIGGGDEDPPTVEDFERWVEARR